MECLILLLLNYYDYYKKAKFPKTKNNLTKNKLDKSYSFNFVRYTKEIYKLFPSFDTAMTQGFKTPKEKLEAIKTS
jgi:hypothetical protein